MSTRRGRSLFGRLILALSLLGLGAAPPTRAWPGLADGWVKAKFEQALADALGGTVSTERIAVAPIDGALEIDGLKLAGGKTLVRELTIGHARVVVQRWNLVNGELRLRQIEASAVTVRLDDRGPSEGPPREGGLPVELLDGLERLTLQDGSIVYRDSRLRFALDARDLTISGAPSGAALEGVASAGATKFTYADYPEQTLESATMNFRWHAPRLELEKIVLRGPSADLTGELLLSFTREGLVVRGAAQGSVVPGAYVDPAVAVLEGRAQVETRFFAASPGTWQAEGTIASAGAVKVDGESLQQFTSHFQLDPQRLVLDQAQLALSDSAAVEGLTFTREESGWRATGTLNAALGPWLQRAGVSIPEIEGTLRGPLLLSRTTADGAYDLQLDAEFAPRRSDGPRGALRVRSAAGGAEATFNGTWAGAPTSVRWAAELIAPGTIGGWTLRGNTASPPQRGAALLSALIALGRSRGIDLKPELLFPQLEGALAVQFAASGRGKAVDHADAQWQASAARYGELVMESLDGEFQLDHGPWTCLVRLANDQGKGLKADVTGGFGSAPRMALQFDAAPIALVSEFARRLDLLDRPLPLDGSISGTATGPWQAGQEALQLALTADWRNVEFGAGELTLRGAASPASLRLDHLEVRADAGKIEARGRLGWGLALPLFEGSVAADLRLERLGIGLPLPALSGRLVAALTGRYEALSAPLRFDGEARWQDLVIAGKPLPASSARFTAGDTGTALQLEGDQFTATVELTGPVQALRLAATVRWSDFDLFSLLPASSAQRLALFVPADGEAQIAGAIDQPESWSGTGLLRRMEVNGPSLGGSMEKETPFEILPGGRLALREATPLVLVGERGSRLTLSGGAQLVGERAGDLDLVARGTIDLGAVEVFNPDLLAAGRLTCDLSIRGSASAPELIGQVGIASGRLRLLPFPESLEALRVQMEFTPGRVDITQGRFRLGGGTGLLSGGWRMSGWAATELAIQLELQSVGISAPRGVWGRYNGDVRLTGTIADPQIGGRLQMISGRYTRDFGITTFKRVRSIEATASSTSFWSRVALALHVDAAESISVRNDMAKLQASAQLEILGTLRQPLLAGTIVLLEGGKLRFRDNDYEVQSGYVLLDDARGEPAQLRMRATTDVRGYQVVLEVDATTEHLDYQLSSTPALAQPDILSLLITGQTLSELGSSEGLLQTDQAAAYFGSKLGELLFKRQVAKLGIDKFQITPTQPGPDATPTARVTVGKRLSYRTYVIYSRDLSSDGRDLYRIERTLGREWRATLGREQSGGTALDLRWLHRAAGRIQSTAGNESRQLLRNVKFVGLPAKFDFGRNDLTVHPGETIGRGAVSDARDDLQMALAEAGYLEAAVNARLTPISAGADDTLRCDLLLEVVPGRPWVLRINAPRAFRRRIQRALAEFWSQTGVAAGDHRQEQAVLKEALANDGYAAAVVQITTATGKREIDVTVDLGPRVKVEAAVVRGNASLPLPEIENEIVSRPGGLIQGGPDWYQPRVAQEDADAIRTLYEDRGYLGASVKVDERLRADGSGVELIFTVVEGGRWQVETVSVEGDWPESLGPAASRLALASGAWFEPNQRALDEAALRDALDEAGYFSAQVLSRVEETVPGRVAVTYRVQAGKALMVRAVRYEGLQATRRKLVERAVAITSGGPLTHQSIRRAERELFRLGLFRNVQLLTRPLEERPGFADLVVKVEEIPRLSYLTTFGYDTEEQFRASAALSNENVAGLGRNGSVQLFASATRQGVRATLEDRHLRRNRWIGLATIGWTREQREGFTLTSVGGALQVGSPERAKERWQLRYQLEDNRFSDVTLDISDQSVETRRLGALIGSYVVDRRDDLFKPRSGWMARTELGVWSSPLGSEESFLRWTGSITKLQPLGSRLVLVGGARAGRSTVFGGTTTVPLSRRFFLGGSSSLRGFARDAVGPVDVNGKPLGGDEYLVLNAELRWRVWGALEAVVFADAGNTWLREPGNDTGGAPFVIPDSPRNVGYRPQDGRTLRRDVGLGVRYASPVGAFRFEYGFNLDPIASESGGEFFFSIGEAF